MDDFSDLFFEGCLESLAEIEDSLLHLEKDPQQTKEVARVFRAMHTIKGSAGMLGFDEISTFAHLFETEFDNVRSGATKVSPDLIAVSLEARDQLQAMAESRCRGVPYQPEKTAAILERLKKVASGKKASSPTGGASVQQVFTILEGALKKLLSMPNHQGLLDLAWRSLKSLRSLALAQNLESIAEFLREFEEVFAEAHGKKVFLSTNLVQLTLSAGKEAGGMFREAMEGPAEDADLDPQALLDSMQRPIQILESLRAFRAERVLSAPAGSGKKESLVKISIRLAPDLVAAGFTREFFFSRCKSLGTINEISFTPARDGSAS